MIRPLWSGTDRTRKSDKRALIVGPYRVHNFGDDLIGAVIATHLQERGYRVSIPRLSAENARWLGTQHAESYDGLFETADLVVVGGGGIMSDTAGAKPGASYLEIISRAVDQGALTTQPLVVTGVGAGPWLRDKSRRLALEVSGIAQAVGVRDQESYEHLTDLGVDENKIVAGADLALLTSDYLRFGRRRTRARKIGIQFDIALFEDMKENSNLGAIQDAVVEFANDNARNVVLVSNGRHRSQLADAAPGCELLRYSTLKDFLPKLAGLDVLMTSHLHLAITAYSQRIPSFSLFVREKTRRFYDQIGHPERAVDLRTATLDDVHRLVESLEGARWMPDDEARLRALKAQSRALLDLLP
ncbi:polysaccharide pyruvyl transferase WcaK-like protein [Microbacterium sp. ZKA21]|uniref:polysaccharide pyruvyl transferase family protein n=1 Tax=Microbacterium sp. ZKA21 TaxID=3381694 RepID=UPI003D252915